MVEESEWMVKTDDRDTVQSSGAEVGDVVTSLEIV